MNDAFLWGRAVRLPELTPARAEALCRRALGLRAAAAARDNWTTLDALGRVGLLWAGPRSTYRRRAMALMPRVTGFSPAMVGATLDLIPRLLDPVALKARLRAELGREDALDS